MWIVSGLTVFACCAVPAMLGWDARVSWTLLVFLSMMAARFAPSLAVDVPDEALLDLDRLAVTAWSARDTSARGAAAASWSPATPWSAWCTGPRASSPAPRPRSW